MAPRRRIGLGIGSLALLVAVEILGRRSPLDVVDAIGVAVVAMLIALAVLLMTLRGDHLPPVLISNAHKLWAGVRSTLLETGVDFRKTPPLPRRFPLRLLVLLAGLATIAWAAFHFRSALPGAARAALLAVSPTLYFVALGFLWSLLLLILVASGVFGWLHLHNRLWNAAMAPVRRGTVEFLVGLVWLSTIIAAGYAVPPWIGWAVIDVACISGSLAALTIARSDPILMAWRSDGQDLVCVYSARWMILWNCFFFALFLLAVTMSATGVGRNGFLAEQTPVTMALGGTATWAGTSAYVLWVVQGPIQALVMSLRDPSRLVPTVLHVEDPGSLTSSELERLRDHGFSCRPRADRAGDGALAIQIRDDESTREVLRLVEQGREVLVIGRRSLLHPRVLAELRRIDSRRRRARVLDGLRGLFALAVARRFRSGTGFWIAPHLWYVRGLARDSDDLDLLTIGAPFRRVIPLPAREHLHRVFKALEIDLVFAEDGLAFDLIEQVFGRVFDHYDVMGPGPIDDRDFAGIVQVRVIVHELTFRASLGREGYPEPNYEEVARARILHIMREREEGTEEATAPRSPHEEPLVAAT